MKSADYLEKASLYLRKAGRSAKKDKITFLCGYSGVLACKAYVAKIHEDYAKVKDYVERLLKLQTAATRIDSGFADELLTGRVGYLYSLMFIRAHVDKSLVPESLIQLILNNVLILGKSYSNKRDWPLMYEWHDKKYVGAAHGISGILFVLLMCKEFLTEENLSKYIRPSIDMLMEQQFPSGNFPSSLPPKDDKLIHWCHGAPGVVHLMLAAYDVFNDSKYLNAAESCGTVTWERGILHKGYGLCHGTAGNAYVFIKLYQTTKNPKYLYNAVKFSEWCKDYGKHGCRIADRPLSLFEGLAGTIYFLVDMMDPEHAKFPAFDL